MKKKVFTALTAALLTVCLAGCGGVNDVIDQISANTDTDVQLNKTGDGIIEIINNKGLTVQVNSMSPSDFPDEPGYLLTSVNGNANDLIIVNTANEIIFSGNSDEILTACGYDISADGPINLIGYDRGALIVSNNMYDAYNSYTGEVYCALYPSKGISLLITSAKNSEASVYNDCLFITESEYDYNGNGRVARTETCFTRPDSSDEYTEINRVGQNYEYLNESYKRIVLSNRSLDGRKMSLTESVESTGFITVCDGDNYYRYDEFGDSYFVTAYSHDEIYYNFDSNYAVAAYSFSEFEKSILITNYVTGATKFITSNFDGILGFRSGCIYYYDEIIGDDRIKSYEIKMYSAWEDETYTLYTTEYNPGVNYDHLDGVTDFYLCGDTIYTTIFNGLSTNWYTITASEDGYSVNDTGCVAKTYSWREYGIMNAQYYRDTCPYCGQTIYRYYSDIYSVLDDIPNCEKINSKLVELDEVRFSANGFTSGTITQEYCDEYHNSEYYFAGDTIDFNVSEVKILSSNYIAIYFDGYTYSGGVHGYPLKTQYVFDLNTGDYIEFSNLFSGSEEDLKEPVANAAKADCASDLETYGYTDYYENDPELVYTSAYETVSLETLYGEFEEDGYHVFFSPYEMGPYASGYIEVIIPYSDLGITIF